MRQSRELLAPSPTPGLGLEEGYCCHKSPFRGGSLVSTVDHRGHSSPLERSKLDTEPTLVASVLRLVRQLCGTVD